MRHHILELIVMSIFCINAYAAKFNLESSSFAANSQIPAQYTCDGKSISPALAWQNAPEKTQSFVMIMSDPDAPNGTIYHWILYNIPPTVSSLSENIQALPNGAEVGNKSASKKQYKGPCPPKGSMHHYVFNLYALDTKLVLTENETDAVSVMSAMQKHVLASVEFKATYNH